MLDGMVAHSATENDWSGYYIVRPIAVVF